MRLCYAIAPFILAAAVAHAAPTIATVPANQPPLKATPFVALALGSVKADGWLLKQLELQKAGLTGQAEEALDEIKASSAWLGGDKENWEKGPYYVKGLVPLAYTLGDDELKQRAQKWIDWSINSARPDGFYGPANNDDWWPRMVSNYFLRDYYEATSDERVLPLLTNYYRFMLKTLPNRPLRDWGRSRAGDEMDTVIWLYNRTKEPALLELVDLLRKQAYDWPAIMHENRFQSFGPDFQPKHNVNVPQALKMPAVSWQRTGDAKERSAVDAGMANLLRENGQSVGMQAGTEFLSGRSPGEGIEFCSIVEQMLSDETIVRILGDGKYADRLEQIAYNALPAAWNRDLTGLQYYTATNFVIAKRGPHGFGQEYSNGMLQGPRSGFPCCCFNVHMGWPKFVQNSWAATPDGGLAPIAYAPTTVTADVAGGKRVTIVEETNYPFADTVKFTIKTTAPVRFPLTLRTPAWCASAKLTVAGKTVDAPKPGAFAKLEREWRDGDVVVLTLPMSVKVDTGLNKSVHVKRGPLLYALRIEENKRVAGQPTPQFPEWEIDPGSPWNYALALDRQAPEKSFELLVDDKPVANPFDKDDSPVKLKVPARKVPQWQLGWNGTLAVDPPLSPVKTDEALETITLLPFGAQNLRLTDFPVVGTAADADRARAVSVDFNNGDASAFTWLGGGWWVNEKSLRTSPNGAVPGFKALLEGVAYADLTITADVTPPPVGDAGVLFRVTNASVGPDAFEGYYAGIDGQGGNVILGRANGTTWKPLKIVGRAFAGGKPVRISVTARGPKIEVRLNDEKEAVISLEDDTWKSGQAGVRMYAADRDKAYAVFDNVSVKPGGK